MLGRWFSDGVLALRSGSHSPDVGPFVRMTAEHVSEDLIETAVYDDLQRCLVLVQSQELSHRRVHLERNDNTRGNHYSTSTRYKPEKMGREVLGYGFKS